MVIINQKINISFLNNDSISAIEHCSFLCNKLYNLLLEQCNKDYINKQEGKENNNLLSGRNLRDYIISIKKTNPYFYEVHSSPLKNIAFRLKEAFEHFFRGNGYPKFRSNRIKWFSLLYDEPNKGIKISGKSVKISLGYKIDESGKKQRLYAYAKLKEKIRKGTIKNFRIIKENNKYYLIVCLEKENIVRNEPVDKRIISIDPNHKNFFVGIDNKGKSVEFENLYQIKYFDKEIDKLKSKRDKCLKKSIKCVTEYGGEYYKPSKRYLRLDKALNKIYFKRKVQIKDALYKISHRLCDNDDIILIGDYVPSIDNSFQKNMHRGMLNQTIISKFRKILEYVCYKRGKEFKIVDETNTTKECFYCGHLEHKEPNVREYKCPCCNKKYNRDINSAINIGKKENLLSSSDYVALDLTKTTYIAKYLLHKQDVVLSLNELNY